MLNNHGQRIQYPSGLSTLNFRVAKLVKSFGLDRESSKVLTTSATALTLILSFDKPPVFRRSLVFATPQPENQAAAVY